MEKIGVEQVKTFVTSLGQEWVVGETIEQLAESSFLLFIFRNVQNRGAGRLKEAGRRKGTSYKRIINRGANKAIR